MSALAELWLIVKKDVRLAKWLLLGYGLLLVAATIGAASGERLADGSLQWAAILLVITGPITAAILIQADSPTSPDAFWASQPFRRSAMLGAKLVLVIGFLFLLPLVGQWLGLMAFDVPAGEQRSLMLVSAALYGVVLLLTMFLAALTRDLKSFVLAVLAFLVAALALAIGMSNLDWRWTSGSPVQAALAAVGLGGVIALLILLYVKRGLPRARTLGVAALALLLLGSVAPDSESRVVGDVSPFPAGKANVRIELRDTAQIAQAGHFTIRVTLVGADSGARFRLDRSRARFFLRDGTTVEMPLWGYGMTTLQVGRLVLPGIPSLQGDADLPFSGAMTNIGQEVSGEPRRALMRGIDSVRVIGSVTLIEPKVFATLPLRAGASALLDGERVTLTALNLAGADDELQLDTRAVGSASKGAGWMDGTTGLNAFLVNLRRGEGVGLPRTGASSNPGILVLPGAGAQHGSIRYRAPRGRGADRYVTDTDWLDGASLMVIRWVDGPSHRVSATSVPLPPDAADRGSAIPSAVVGGSGARVMLRR